MTSLPETSVKLPKGEKCLVANIQNRPFFHLKERAILTVLIQPLSRRAEITSFSLKTRRG